MSTIKSSLSLYDGVSSPAARMANALNSVLSSFQAVQSASDRAIDPSAWNEARGALSQVCAELDEIEQSAKLAAQGQDKFNKKVREGQSAADSLKSKIMSYVGAIGAGFGAKAFIDLADSMTTPTAKLNLINDGLQTTEQLQNMIFASANRGRASYQSTADAVARLGANAKDAFSSTAEIVAFAEQVNKQFVLSGTEASAAAGAMTQLTQALGSGVLRGDELNSIFEAAPTLIQSIAKEMGVSVGQIRSLAAEGKITADIVKNAMLNTASETNAKFESMPITFAQLWQKIQNNLLKAFTPLIRAIGKGADWIDKHWSVLGPVFYGLAGAVGAYVVALGAMKVASIAAKVAQEGLGKAMLANPAALVAVGIGALVTGIKYLADTVGGFGNLWTLVCGYVTAGWNYAVYGVLWGIDKIETGLGEAGKFIYRVVVSISKFFDDLWAGIVTGVEWVVNQLIDAINTIVKITNPVLASLGQDGMVVQHVSFAADTRKSMDARKASWDASYANYARGIDANKTVRANILGTVKARAENAVPNAIAKVEASKAAAQNQSSGDTFGSDGALGGIGNSVGETAQNTAQMADTLTNVTADLSFLRSLAERRAVSQYTNATVTLDMSGMNNTFKNDMDVDGFVEIVTVKLDEALASSAEGVHW